MPTASASSFRCNMLHVEVANVRTVDSTSFINVLFLVEQFPAMLPQNMHETRTRALDTLEMECVND